MSQGRSASEIKKRPSISQGGGNAKRDLSLPLGATPVTAGGGSLRSRDFTQVNSGAKVNSQGQIDTHERYASKKVSFTRIDVKSQDKMDKSVLSKAQQNALQKIKSPTSGINCAQLINQKGSTVIPEPKIPKTATQEFLNKSNFGAQNNLNTDLRQIRTPFSTKALQTSNRNRIAPKQQLVLQPTLSLNQSMTLGQTMSIPKSLTYDEGDDPSAKYRWRSQYDSNQIYRLDQKLSLADERALHQKEIRRWRDADVKGNRSTYYIKEVQRKNADIMTIVEQTRLERAHSHTDGHKCLNVRKKIMKIRIHISDASMQVTSSKYFEGFIILVIGLNCITLAQSDSTKEETLVEKNIDLTFNIIYTIEMFLRIFSLGFIFGKGAYMKSMWCQLDFICVTTAYLELVGGGGTSLGGLRAFRVLRPLRFVNNIQGLKSIVQSVMKAIPVLKDTILVLFFFFLIFAIGGLNLFMGQLKNRCIHEMTGQTLLDDEGEEILCGNTACPSDYYCGKRTLNPNFDTTNFDNIFWALLNVFQCITLEGWSEIMVMYQKVYSPFTIFFFVPMVFIGAFFLLNLTLAVIQSSYSQTQGEQKAAKEKLLEEQNLLVQAAQNKTNKASGDDDGDDDEDGAMKHKRLNIGVTAFFIAKRAAIKMKRFWQRHQKLQEQLKQKAEREAEDRKRQQKIEEHAELLRRSNALKKQSLRRKGSSQSVSPDKRDRLSGTNSLGAMSNSDKKDSKEVAYGQRDNTAELEEQFLRECSAENANKTITEEDCLSEENYSEDVINFLKKVATNQDQITGLDMQAKGEGNVSGSRTFREQTRQQNPIMAFNDVRISAPHRGDSNGRKTYSRQDQNGRANKNFFSKENAPQIITSKNREADLVADLQADWLLEKVDFDKVVKKSQVQESDMQRIGSPEVMPEAIEPRFLEKSRHDNRFDEVWDVGMQIDLSLSEGEARQQRNVNYSLDDKQERPKVLMNVLSDDDDDLKSSIISSDESINAKITRIDYTDGHKRNFSRVQTRVTRRDFFDDKLRKSKELNSKVKRMLTTDFVKNQMNDSQTSFLNNTSFRQQLDCLSNLQLNAENSSMKRKTVNGGTQGFATTTIVSPREKTEKTRTGVMTGTMISAQDPRGTYQSNVSKVTKDKQAADKQQKIKLYNDLGEYFNNVKPLNPMTYIDTSKQKVMINPGVPYVSTSQNEIFERRNFLFQKEYLNKINPFIAAPKDDVVKGPYEGDDEETYIGSLHEAYQMKTLYKVKQVDEMELDSDDEDALILAQQPFETVMQTGFKNYLNHLNTKFIARRSDIIVSSTLSITLTPIDDMFVPAHFAFIDAEGIWDYVMKRQEYRAYGVVSNTLPKPGALMNQDYSDESSAERSDDAVSRSAMTYSAFEEDQKMFETDEKNSNNTVPMVRLPATLQSEPLDPKKVPFLSVRERRMYNLQKRQYEQQLKTNSRKPVHPRDLVLDLDDAKQLINGTYHQQDDDEDQAALEIKVGGLDGKCVLNRAMVNIKDAPKEEMKLEGFENKLINTLQDSNFKTNSEDPRQNSDYVPEEIKKEFDLNRDMSQYEIDFVLVRTHDAQFKKRQPTWSGQEVLDIGLNMAKSQWILKKVNKLRVWPKGFHNLAKKVRCLLKQFIRLSIFDNFLTLCVLINTVVMAMDSYDIDAQTQEDLDFLNQIFTWIFIVEMTLKLMAFGPKKYAKSPMNLLDGGVVTLSIVEIVMGMLGGGSGTGSLQAFRTVRVFRTFRVLRVTRILRALKSMAQVIGVIQRTFMDFILITILMFVFIFIYTLLGRQIFQGNYDFGPDADLPRANYESFTVAFITVFQVLTMENWQQVLFSSMRAANNNMIFKTITAIYYISWIFIGNFILLNLFLAILIDGFAEEDDELSEEDLAAQEAAKLLKQKRLKEEKDKRMKKLGTSAIELKRMQSQAPAPRKKKKEKVKASFTGQQKLREEDLDDIEDMNSEEIRKLLVSNGILKPRASDEIDLKEVGPEIKADKSLYLFARGSCFRRNIHFIQKHAYFDSFIMLLIALSSVKLAMESYMVDTPDDAVVKVVSTELDFIFNYLFNFECVLKVIALGFAMDEGSYLRDSWNKLDFFIVVTSNIDMLLAGTDIPALKVLRMLRMIRPLRVISHNPQLKMIVAALFESVGSIVNVSFIVLIIWLMFAIYGMNTFMGMFFYCSEEPYRHNTKWVCEDQGGQWLKHDSNFDDIGQAMMTLFIVASLEGWPDIMYQAIDVTKRDNGPKEQASVGYAAFFVVFILIGSFFFLNFFIGVLFLKYEQAQKREEAGFNKQQLYWQELQRLIVSCEVPHPDRYKPLTRGFRYRMHQFVEGNLFGNFIMVCIVLNMLQMALDHDGASPSFIEFLDVTNYIFTVVFLVEAIFKLFVYRWNYFKLGWNKFDFFVVASSLIDIGLNMALPKPEGGQDDSGGSSILSVGPQLARVLRVLRVSRVLRIAKKNEGLQALLKTIMMSIDSLFNVFILLMLIFFIMAVLGNTMFYQVYEGDVINDFKNFTNFHQSFSLLFSISTGEDWNRIMYDTMDTAPNCNESKTCGSSIAPVFFLSFIMIVSNIMLNLFILVIIQQFQKFYLEADNPLMRFELDFKDFKTAWSKRADRYSCIKMKPKHIPDFFNLLPNRMKAMIGFSDQASPQEINRIVLKMGINVDDGFIYFHEMLYRIMRAQFVTRIGLKFNRVMTVQELVTQYKIAEITLKNKMLKKISRSALEEFYFLQNQSMPVNLFLTKMFYKTSFKAWRNYTKKLALFQKWNREQEQERERCEIMGKHFVEQTYVEQPVVMEEVEIEREVFSEWTVDSDEDLDDDTKSRRSYGFGTHKMQSEWTKSQKLQQSPENFRQKAKSRISSNQKKFSIVLDDNDVKMNQTSKLSSPKKHEKVMLIAHTEQEEQLSRHLKYVDPNSIAYQNAVLESKINSHQKSKGNNESKLGTVGPGLATTMRQSMYAGHYQSEQKAHGSASSSSYFSPSRLNAPLKSHLEISKSKKPRSKRSRSSSQLE